MAKGDLESGEYLTLGAANGGRWCVVVGDVWLDGWERGPAELLFAKLSALLGATFDASPPHAKFIREFGLTRNLSFLYSTINFPYSEYTQLSLPFTCSNFPCRQAKKTFS
jgi:hypothetical protein